MNHARDLHTATLLADGRVLAAGGIGGSAEDEVILDSAEIYEPATNRWSFTASMRSTRLEHTATLLADGRVLVTGGLNRRAELLASSEIYDPATNRWSGAGDIPGGPSTASMSRARSGHTATLLANGRVLVTGAGSAEIYNPIFGSWVRAHPMNHIRFDHTATLLSDGRVLVTGGFDPINNELLDSTEIYDPASDTWSLTNPMNSARSFHTATLLSRGEVLVTGGFGRSIDSCSCLDSAETYDPSTGIWTLTWSRRSYESYSHAATRLPDGRVLVTGGVGQHVSSSNSVEVYEPASRTWSPEATLGNARRNHSATLLADGRVLVTGGSGVNERRFLPDAPLESAEVFVQNTVAGELAFSRAVFTVDEFGATPVALITVVLTGGPASQVTVFYGTSAGAGVAIDDYRDVSGMLTFEPGDTTATFEVPIRNDALTEGAETINLFLFFPRGGAVLGTPRSAKLTIAENDTPNLSFNRALFTAPKESGLSTITVNRRGGVGTVVTVSYTTANGTATAGQDYTATTGTLTFGENETAKSFTVPILTDSRPEEAETIRLTLSNPTGGAVLGARSTAVLEIPANDGAVLQFNAATYTAAAEKGLATITVTREGILGTTVSVKYATSNGTAMAGQDYTARTGTLTFPANVTSRTFTVPILPDTRTEGTETINLTLSQPTAGAVLGGRRTAVLTIPANDTPRLQFDAASYTAAAESGERAITITRTGGFGSVVSVAYATSNGTAGGADYTTKTGRLTFGINETRKTFTVPIKPDTAPEGPETINLRLSSPSGGAVLGTPSRAVLTIPLNDTPVLQFSAASYQSAQPDNVEVTVTRTGSFGTRVSVAYATGGGTANAGQDYTANTGRLTFEANDTAKTFVVRVVGPATGESEETINLQLSAVQGGAILGTQRTAVINIERDKGGGP